MFQIPKGRFLLTGGCEALAQLLMMAGGWLTGRDDIT
jgi:hypothetical protein